MEPRWPGDDHVVAVAAARGYRSANCKRSPIHLTLADLDELDHRVITHAQERPQAVTILTHPGVGPVTALATEVFLGDPSRFADGKAVWPATSGMIPSEYSSRDRQRLGKSRNREPAAAAALVRSDHSRRATRSRVTPFYRRKLQRKGFGKARVAAARKLGIRLWILLRDPIDYSEFCRRAS